MDEALFKRWLVLHDRYGQGMDKPWRRITNADDRRENAEVVRMITEAGEQGHALAQSHLGTMYLYGNGVPQSDALAVEWCRKAADQGFAQAQSNLGVMYDQGQGVPQSGVLAVEWYRKAADQGYAPAQFNLGAMYANGQGVPQNFPEALRWLRKAHAQGDEQAAGAIEQVLQAQRQHQQGAAAAASPPSPASSSSSPQSPISIGTRVELHGLKAKPELNGQRGVVAGFDAASGRCKVELEDGRGPFKLKVGNLKRA